MEYFSPVDVGWFVLDQSIQSDFLTSAVQAVELSNTNRRLQLRFWERLIKQTKEIAMSSARQVKDMPRKRGAVGVLLEEHGFLVIRRSPFVRAPNLICFPGGTIEGGESSENAVIREMHEELGLKVDVREKLWKSVTSWGTELEWFLLNCADLAEPKPDPREVSEVFWARPQQLLTRGDLLGSVIDFFRAIRSGEIQLDRVEDFSRWTHLLKR